MTFTIPNGSCGDALLKTDIPGIIRALEDLDLITEQTMIAVDDGLPVMPRRRPSATRGAVQVSRTHD